MVCTFFHFSSQQTPMHPSMPNSEMISSVKPSQTLSDEVCSFLFCACKVLSMNSSKSSFHIGLQLWVNQFVSPTRTLRSSSAVKFYAGLSSQSLAHSSSLNEWMKSVTEPLSCESSSAHPFGSQSDSATENKEKMQTSRKKEGSINKFLCVTEWGTWSRPSQVWQDACFMSRFTLCL